MLQTLSGMDKQKRFELCADFQHRFEDDDFADCLVFTNETTFHIGEEQTITGTTFFFFLNMLTLGLMPQLQDAIESFILQLEGALSQWSNYVLGYLDEHLPDRWIGRAADDNMTLTQWSPRSLHLTPCDFFL
ncbi:uncharacterized protein NPIL_371521 [Nephila pilipes]|uniref:Uncharacterized protein n=1 Tax=Nephila pilipes TaxID=299642 RepID=A0A8X6N005_NEPPI|nr:uncharacterized protein NPIL_371521 [Nephila pilipes]